MLLVYCQGLCTILCEYIKMASSSGGAVGEKRRTGGDHRILFPVANSPRSVPRRSGRAFSWPENKLIYVIRERNVLRTSVRAVGIKRHALAFLRVLASLAGSRPLNALPLPQLRSPGKPIKSPVRKYILYSMKSCAGDKRHPIGVNWEAAVECFVNSVRLERADPL